MGTMPKSFSYVLVPCDESKPFQECKLTPKKNKEVECLPQALQEYFKKGETALTAEQKAELKSQITAQSKQPVEITDQMLDMMASASVVDIVPLYPNRPVSDFIGVS